MSLEIQIKTILNDLKDRLAKYSFYKKYSTGINLDDPEIEKIIAHIEQNNAATLIGTLYASVN